MNDFTPPSTPVQRSISARELRMLQASSALNKINESHSSLSPPLVTLQEGSIYLSNENDREDDSNDIFASVPSYAYALIHTDFALLPSLPVHNHARPFTPPASPPFTERTGRNDDWSLLQEGDLISKKKRKASAAAENWRKGRNNDRDKIRKLKKSPALRQLGIFTHAAFAEEEESFAGLNEMTKTMDDVHMNMDVDRVFDTEIEPTATRNSIDLTDNEHNEHNPILHETTTESTLRKVDLTVLVSSLPSFCPYPPTPRSTLLPPLSLSSTIQRLSIYPSATSVHSHQQIKQDVSDRLRLGCVGLGIEDIKLYTSAEKDIERDQIVDHMTAVVHTS